MRIETKARESKLGVLLACAGLMGLGCGDGGNGPAGNLTLAELSDDELIGLCEDGQSALASEIGTPEEFGCLLQAIFAASLGEGTPAACEEARTMCLANPPGDTDFETYDCSPEELGSTEGCDVTVDELRACLADLNATIADAVSGISCDLVGTTENPGDIPLEEEPASCLEIERRCPMF